MIASTQRPRAYTVADLKHVLHEVDADSWNDVIDYLQQETIAGTALSRESAAEMTSDMKTLKNDGQPFTTDYRRVWQELTGEQVNGAVLQPADTELDRNDGHADGSATSSSRVRDLLHRLESKEYQQMASDLQRFGDRGWKRD